MKKRFLNLFALLAIGNGVVAQQQQNAVQLQELDEVVVSDSRFQLKRENSGKTVIKITAQELERNQGRTMAEIINAKSGIEIAGSRGRLGEVLGVYARGGRGRQTLVLIDGVRISDPSSFSQEYDLRLLSPSMVESVEIIKGAASTLYGTNAATAVISITTKRASKKAILGRFESNFGTNQSKNDQNYNIGDFSNSVNIGGTLNKFTYLTSFSNAYQNGLSSLVTPTNEKDVFSRINTSLRLGYQFSDNFKISVYGNQTKTKNDYDESFGLYDASYQYFSEQQRAGISTDYSYKQGSFHINAALTEFKSEDLSAFPADYNGKNTVVDAYNKYTFNNKFYSILGLNYIEDEAELDSEKKFTITDPYANVVYVSDFGLNLNAGLRLNNHSEYGSHFVYNFNPSYTMKSDEGYLKLLGSYATSYITPTLNHLFGSFGSNPDLKPEENRTIEGGFEYAVNNELRFSTLYFDRKEENAVVYDNSTFGYLNNLGIINANGVEAEVYWKPTEVVNFSANYTFTERKGDNAIRIPKHKINATLGYEFSDSTFASLQYQLTGKRLDTDFNTYSDVTLDSFSLLDFYLSQDVISNKLKLFLSLNNVFNTEYTEVIGYTTRGRNVRVGLSLIF